MSDIVERLREISNAIARGDRSELTMRIPVEPNRDADLVCAKAADELERLRAERDALAKDAERLNWVIGWLSFNDCVPNDLPTRDWIDSADARKAIDAALAKEKKG